VREAADVETRRGLILLMALLASGCAAPNPKGPVQPGATTPLNPLPTIDQRDLAGGRLTCGEGDAFPAAALQGPGGAEFGNDDVAAALRTVLAEGGDPQIPRSGWHLVSASSTQAQFVARGRGDSGWSVIVLERGPSGWTMDLAGECRLQFVLAPGIKIASWWLDPAAGVPAPTATAIDVLVHEECGLPTVGRVAAPVVVYAPDAVTMLFGVVPAIGGGHDAICLDSPPSPYRVTLTEPLGQRRLLDGGVIPPRDATKPPG
jgi:hypothetical protein